MNQRDAFERVVDALNEAMIDDARWPRTSALVDEALGAKGSAMTFGDEFPKGNIEIFFARSYFQGEDRSVWLQEYFRNYYPDDEHMPRLRRLTDSQIVPVADLFSEQELKTSRTYNEALVRFEGRNGLNVRLDGPRGSRIVWAIANPVHASGWWSSQIDMLRRILPHFRQYVVVHTALVEARALGSSVTELLGNTRTGVIHLDRRGRMIEVNDSARDLLLRNVGLSDRGGRLSATRPHENTRLQNLLARALPPFGEQAQSGSMLVGRLALQPRLVLHVKPVGSREVDDRSSNVAALVLVTDPRQRPRIDRALVASVLGLSPAEAEIAVLLAGGHTSREIAAATGRSYSTVRTHLKHMFAKLGVSRQFEVSQLVLALSNLPESRDW